MENESETLPSITSPSPTIQSVQSPRPIRISIPSYKLKDQEYEVSPINLDEYCGNWLGSSCTIWGYIFCFNRMSRYKRLEILWSWILFTSLFTGFGIGLGLYGINVFTVGPTDMRIIQSKYSTLFCENVYLRSAVSFDAYRFTNDLEVNQTSTELFKREYTNYVEHGNFKYYKYYLLEWSKIDVVSCSDDLMELYVIAGDANFQNWKENSDCILCFIYRAPVRLNGCFLDYNKFSLTVSETDNYFFAFINRNVSSWVTVKVHINRYLYDVSNAIKVCSQTRNCLVNLNFDSKEKVVYHVAPFTDPGIKIMTSTCQARLVFYSIIFAVMPGCVGLVLSIILFFACKDPHSKDDRIKFVTRQSLNISRSSPSETTPLINSTGHTPSASRSNSYSPPTYEEAIS